MHGVWLVVSGLWFGICLADALWLGKPKSRFSSVKCCCVGARTCNYYMDWNQTQKSH